MTSRRVLHTLAAWFVVAVAASGGCASIGLPLEPAEAAPPALAGPVTPPDPGLLRVGVTPDAPPMVFRRGGAIVGLEADFAGALAKALGREVRFVELAWEDQIRALDENRIDIIMSAMSVTREREVRMLFSYPYMRGGLSALVRRDEMIKYLGPLGFVMSEDKVAVQAATTGDFFVQQNMPRASRQAYRSASEAYEAVARGSADLMIHDAPVVWWMASERPGANLVPLSGNLTAEYYAWAVRRDDQTLRDEVNAVLSQWKADGTLSQVVRTWLPTAM